MQNLPPGGWYPDPHDPAFLRYWDSEKWTGNRHPADGSTPPTPAGVAATGADTETGAGGEPDSIDTDSVNPAIEEASGSPVAAWYPDPEDDAQDRYWDGTRWTDERRPAQRALTKEQIREQRAAGKARAKEQKSAQRAENQAARDQAKIEKAAVRAELERQERENYGDEVAWGMFGGRTIRIYSKGYAQVYSMVGRKASARFERLMSIEASSDVQKKSGLGRGAAAVMTMGVNLAGSNKRGDVYLTIVTDHDTYVLRESPPTEVNMRTTKKLEAAGRSVEGRAGHDPEAGYEAAFAEVPEVAAPPVSAEGASVRERLRQLQGLFEDGLISQEEYDQKRAALLDAL